MVYVISRVIEKNLNLKSLDFTENLNIQFKLLYCLPIVYIVYKLKLIKINKISKILMRIHNTRFYIMCFNFLHKVNNVKEAKID